MLALEDGLGNPGNVDPEAGWCQIRQSEVGQDKVQGVGFTRRSLLGYDLSSSMVDGIKACVSNVRMRVASDTAKLIPDCYQGDWPEADCCQSTTDMDTHVSVTHRFVIHEDWFAAPQAVQVR